MGKDALTLGAGLLGPDRVGYLRIEYLDVPAVGLPEQGADLPGKVGPAVHHRQQDAVNEQLGIDLPPHLAHGLQELFKPFRREVLRLDGDDQAIGSGQGVDGEHTQGGLAVQQDVGVLFPNRVQILPQDGLAAHGVHQRHLHAGELDV